MQIAEVVQFSPATVRIHQERPYDFDEKRGLWLYRQVDEDSFAHNIITSAGRVALHTYIYGTAAQRVAGNLSGTGLNYIGLSNDAGAPGAGDTALTGELTADGLGRAQGTVTLPVGAGTVTTVVYQFTYVGAGSQGVQKTALFDTAGPPPAGKMAHEIQFTPRTLFPQDTLTVTYSITLGA